MSAPDSGEDQRYMQSSTKTVAGIGSKAACPNTGKRETITIQSTGNFTAEVGI